MKKKILYGVIVLLLFGFVGCATSVHKNANRVSAGMSKQQVQNIMGAPTKKDINSDGTERWYYFQAGAFEYRTVWVYFDASGKVVRLETGY